MEKEDKKKSKMTKKESGAEPLPEEDGGEDIDVE